ncbi:hypothetical protein OU787_08695 [Kitasatospora sp. YST-16]|nr:hypothetical protein [Kitasatospora sp. YST-16]WAL71576.1 hypothetical protein OU787_08695 [Kitasatospora sp. YST-16]WNW37616.1 hypothetical protein RKE32_08645 [Streptomyces sp. Li-HN-5-13]
MIAIEPILEIWGPDNFSLRPVVTWEQRFPPLNCALDRAEVGTV